MKQRSVEIIGAGLSGLVAANRFAQKGWKVRIHERNAELRMFGAGIWLWESGLKTLETIGAYDAAVARARQIREWQIRDHNGRILMSRHAHDKDRLLLPPRADLYQALIDQRSRTASTIVTSSLAIGVTPDGGVQFESGAKAQADLVIVADGAYSRLRESILGTKWNGLRLGGRHPHADRRGAGGQPGHADRALERPLAPALQPLHRRQELHLPERAGGPTSVRAACRSMLAHWTEKFPQCADLIRRSRSTAAGTGWSTSNAASGAKAGWRSWGDAAHAMPTQTSARLRTLRFIKRDGAGRDCHASGATFRQRLADWESRQRSNL
jgi:2-polyprenyl-6-methoxyphenol hydroxylase-like FAD-dependent oxidoreductase